MKTLSLIAVLLLSPAAFAGDQTVSFGLFGGELITDPLEVLGDTPMVAPRIGYWVNPTLAFELDVAVMPVGRTQVGLPDPFGYFATVPTLNMVGRVFANKPVSLLLSVGAGAFVKSVADDGALKLPTGTNVDVDFAGEAGPGLLVPLGDVALRAEYRWILNVGTENWQNHGDAFIDGQWTVGLMYLRSGPKDTDKDGIVDASDSCIDQPEDKDNYMDADGCPDLDNDQDGVPDTADKCPDQAEDMDKFTDDDGCPDPDNDADGVLDSQDRCPDVAGTADTSGCPDADADKVMDSIDECVNEAGGADAFGCPDRDADRVPDYRDECPDDKAPDGIDPLRSDGCTRKYYIAADKIVILDQVKFANAKATILPVSFPLLDGVASILQKATGIHQLQVEGHTDNVGNDDVNLALSQARADSVKAYLVAKGVSADRLVSKGFGETRPIASNDTADGRVANRRVEFSILAQDTGVKEVSEAPPHVTPATETAPAPTPTPAQTPPQPQP